MHIEPRQLFSNSEAESGLNRIVQFPLVRIILAVLFLAPAILVFNLLYGRVLPGASRWSSYPGDAGAVMVILLAYAGYLLYTRGIEKRPAYELSRRQSIRETGTGFGLGAGLVICVVLSILLLGEYRVVGTHPAGMLIHALFIFGLLAFMEDLLYRVVLFRLLEELLGTWISVIIIALVFGLTHLVHEEATAVSTLAIALQDLILAGAFVLTRRIWLCWGIHWGWNFAQDGVFGMPDSGVTYLPSWAIPEVSGPTWLTGGSIGIELSVLGVVLSILAGIVLLRMALNRGQVLPPGWKRGRAEAPQVPAEARNNPLS
jgi:membrane protease YdiL (CAAX protease family)